MSKEKGIFLIDAVYEKNKESFIKKITGLVKKRRIIGYAGYSSRKDLEKNLLWQVFDENSPDKNFDFDKKRLKK